MEAIGRNIVISKVVEAERRSNGLYLGTAETSEMRYQKGVIETVGGDVIGLSAGDVIYYDKARAYDVSIEGRVVTVIGFADVVVKI